MKALFLFSFLTFSIGLCAQNFQIGIKSGINFTNVKQTITFFDPPPKTHYKFGLAEGIMVNYIFKNKFSLCTELNYSQRGYKSDIQVVDDFGNPVGDKPVIYNYEYLSLPIKAGLRLGNKYFFIANIGVISSLLLAAKVSVKTFKETITYNLIDETEKFDFGGLIEAGGGFQLNKKFNLFYCLGSQFSFTPYDKQNPNWVNKHYGFSFSLGLNYLLIK